MFIDKPTINEIDTNTGELNLGINDLKTSGKLILSESNGGDNGYIYFDENDKILKIDPNGDNPSNIGILNILGDVDLTENILTANYLQASRFYLGDNGSNSVFSCWLQERPSLTNKRIMFYGESQSNAFGLLVAASDLTPKDISLNLWDSDTDGGASTFSYGGITLNGFSENSNLWIQTAPHATKTGDILIKPNSSVSAVFKKDGTIEVKNKIAHYADTDSYISFTANDNFQLSLNNTVILTSEGSVLGNAMYIGDVTVGTSFTIYGSLKAALLFSFPADVFYYNSSVLFYDNIKLYFGTESDSYIYFSGTQLIIDPNLVTNTNTVSILGDVGITLTDFTDNGLSVSKTTTKATGASASIYISYTISHTAPSTVTHYSLMSSLNWRTNFTATNASYLRNTTVVSGFNLAASGDIVGGFDNIHNRLNINGSLFTGTIDAFSYMHTIWNSSNNPKVTALYGVRMDAMSANMTNVTSCYGINIGDISGAATDNYSIYTNLGKVRFGDELVLTSYLDFNDTNTQIYEDGSGNLTFKDANIGVLTLSDLTKPKLIYIVADDQIEGNLNLSDVTNWNVDKAIIKEIIIKTTSSDWDLYIIQNDNYPTDDAVIKLRELFSGASGNKDLLLDLYYEDEDASKEVHLYWTSNSGVGDTADITILGVEAR